MISYLTVVQARMGSARLPGKVMLELCSAPVIRHVVERLGLSNKTGRIVVATSVNGSDDSLCGYLQGAGIDYFRGSETDVLDRFYQVSQCYPSDAVIRATADNPLVDPKILDETADFFERERFRYVKTHGFPVGVGIEIFTTELLEQAHRMSQSGFEREHVTPYMYTAQQSHGAYVSGHPTGQYRLTMDTRQDYELIRDIYEHLYHGVHDFFLDDILGYLKRKETGRIQ
jgi:spore coat polysaccharide biosynthesis protein SpsF